MSVRRPAAAVSNMDQLIGGAYQVLSFSQLDMPYKLAVAHYVAVDGEAWPDILPADLFRPTAARLHQVLVQAMPAFEAQYGDKLFGVALLPSTVAQHGIMSGVELAEDFPDWAAYHAWYASSAPLPEHPVTDRWPVILSDTDDEFLQDGWHRVHCYLKRGDETIPAVFYPRAHHLERRRACA